MKVIVFLTLFAVSAIAHAIESGDKCTSKQRLPRGFTCMQDEIYDCRRSVDGGMGRMGYAACGSMKNDLLKQTVLQLNTKILANVNQEPEESIDHREAKESLAKSHATWRKAMEAQCALENSLLGKGGNGHAGLYIDCEREQLQSRIKYLKSIQK
jgi:uncharacterized protein YecT (DUF1311 family)